MEEDSSDEEGPEKIEIKVTERPSSRLRETLEKSIEYGRKQTVMPAQTVHELKLSDMKHSATVKEET